MQEFEDWIKTPLGSYVFNWEQRWYGKLVSDLFGFHALQLGLGAYNLLADNRMPHQIRCDSDTSALARASTTAQQSLLCADARTLPLQANSIDLVILPHVLEFSAHPHEVLAEVARVLVPEGRVIITSFNPYSLFGLTNMLQKQHNIFPWRGNYLAVSRLKDWFTLLGFETAAGAYGCYIPAVKSQIAIDRLAFLEKTGDRWWPAGGGVYMLQAVKRVRGQRLIMPRWRTHRRAASAAVIQLHEHPGSSKTLLPEE